MIRENIHDVKEALSFYSGIGVDYLSFKPYSEHPHMHRKSGFAYSQDMVDEVETIVTRYAGKGQTTILFRKLATSAYMGGIPKFSNCRALPFWGHICSKGDFYTCGIHLKDERFKTGNIYKETMGTILMGDARKRSIAFALNKLDIRKECRLNCRMARINEFLDFLEHEPDHINFI
jgi:sulfatase maturation enzyme AslB (radical SAM superfamily)